ncbi:MAG: dihydrodipicolinate synthase family protein [Planctomycetota bacterium]|jgi:dihydrodipicolinate synthase/N-acetylneuraminate lyase
MDESAKTKRQALITRLFGKGIPRLWCPPLTHYTDDGSIDLERMSAHLGHMSGPIKTYLVPGTTGDGWEMTEEQIRRVLTFDLDIAQKLNIQILVGILKTDAETARQSIVDTLAWLKERTGIENNEEVIEKTPVCGFAVCPPRGSNLTQEQIYNALVPVLELGVPVALYQLPQVTENEMSPETVAKLAAEFGNFYLFKDSSGRDKVALSGLDFGGVYLLRGAEGDYHKWLRTVGGCYDGFLLGSGNCFARQLKSIIQDLFAGNLKTAQDLSARVTGVVNDVSDGAADIPSGNPFTNANKAIDHFFAHGPGATDIEPPRIHSGQRLPAQIITIAAQALTRNGLMPTNGYLPTQGE